MNAGETPLACRRRPGWLSADPFPRWLGAFVVALFMFLAWVSLTKPHHIDDTLFVRSARALGQSGDPLAFTVNWSGSPQPAAIAFTNPPGMSALVLVCEMVLGQHEYSARVASVLALLLLLVAVARLSTEWEASRLWSCAFALSTPAVAVCSGSIMADTLCAAAMALGIAEWMRFLRTGRILASAWAIACLVLAVSAKYAGLLAIVPCAAASWRSTDGRRAAVILLVVPPAALAAYAFWVSRVHEVGLVETSGSITRVVRDGGSNSHGTMVIALGFLGGAFLAGPLLAFRAHRPALGQAAIILLSTAALAWLALDRIRLAGRYPHVLPDGGSWPAVIVLQFTCFACLGALCLVWIVRRLLATEGTRRWVLGSWIACGLAYFLFVNWDISVRGLMPVMPLFAVCAASDSLSGRATRSGPIAILLVSAVVSVLLAVGDRGFAIAAREDAQSAAAGRNAWLFQGHWGFQHYAESWGGQALDLRAGKPPTGSVIVVPMQNDVGESIPGDWISSLARWSRSIDSPLLPLGAASGTGFYGATFGPLPYGVSRAESMETWVLTTR